MSTLTELPNIGPALAARLESIGVTNHAELAAVGLESRHLLAKALIDGLQSLFGLAMEAQVGSLLQEEGLDLGAGA